MNRVKPAALLRSSVLILSRVFQSFLILLAFTSIVPTYLSDGISLGYDDWTTGQNCIHVTPARPSNIAMFQYIFLQYILQFHISAFNPQSLFNRNE